MWKPVIPRSVRRNKTRPLRKLRKCRSNYGTAVTRKLRKLWSNCRNCSTALRCELFQKLQDDLYELGQKVKHHEANVKHLKTLKTKFEESSLNMQAALAKCDKSSISKEVNIDSIHAKSEEEIIERILKHEHSAAAILCRMKSEAEALSIDHSLTKDVIGIVATLGKVEDDNLSRLYLGIETMLGVVCETYEGVKALEAYNKQGSVNKSFGLHAFASSVDVERPLAHRFLVICLENIRSYVGEFISNDPQRRLAIPNPRLPNSETPNGFLGFAVNMITIEATNLYCALFYNLFSNLQVYRSRQDMLKAISCLKNGAVSLDGGMIRSPRVFSLGLRHERGIDVKFPIGAERLVNVPLSYLEIEKTMKETRWKKDRTCEDMKREQALLDHARFNYETKKLSGGSFYCFADSTSQVAQASARVTWPTHH
ncbi:hypothetical protein ABFS83_06G100900 [Erythranthe nasuta]